MKDDPGVRPLGHRTFDNLPVEAFKHPLVPCFPGGPVLTDPEFARFRHQRGGHPCDRFDELASFDDRLEGNWVYVGPKHDHFGHIMAEAVHRIVPSKMFFPGIEKYLIVANYDDEGGRDSLCRSYREALDFCEIDFDSILVLNRNTIVERLSISEQGSNLEGRPTNWYLDVLRDFSTRRLDDLYGDRRHPEKVYVSKSKIPHGGRILGERYIETLLEDEGFFVFYPEEAPLSAQMDVYRKAKQLVFSEGSAFHGTELLGASMLERTFLLVRRAYARDVFANILQPRSKHFEMFFDTFFLGTIVVDPETRAPHSEFGVSLMDVGRLAEFFRDRQLAQLDTIDVAQYFDAAEQDLKDYFQFHTHAGLAELDPWRVGEVRLAFEKLRNRFLTGHVQVSSDFPGPSDDADTIAERAWTAHKSRKWLEAAQRWEAYRDRFPDAGEGFTLGSIALIELGRFYEADALLRMAIEKFPEFSEVRGNYALVAHNRRDWREAASRWEAFRAEFPQEKMGYSLGANALCELGRYGDANSVLLLGLERHPNDEVLLETHAWVAELTAEKSEARRRWTKLATEYPNNKTALSHLDDVEGEAESRLD